MMMVEIGSSTGKAAMPSYRSRTTVLWEVRMVRSGYLREQAETCLRLSQRCSNRATAAELRMMAAEFVICGFVGVVGARFTREASIARQGRRPQIGLEQRNGRPCVARITFRRPLLVAAVHHALILHNASAACWRV
jgi:hypothetical protein